MITRLLSRLGYEKREANPNDPWGAFTALRTGPVNSATAQGVSAVYACVQAISETTASLPLILYRREGDDRTRAGDHPLYKVLHDIANPQMSALEFREVMQAAVLLRGNAYARIVRGHDGQVRELWPVNPDSVSVLRVSDKLAYEYADKDGKVVRLLQDEMLHLRHRIGDDGVLGVSPIQAAREVIQLAISEREHGNATFTNGAKLAGVLKYPGKLKPEQKAALRESWTSRHSGTANSGSTAVLEEGMDYQPISMTLEDAEWIEARKFSVIEVCRLFRVPPVVIQSMESANYSNSVELARQFVTLCLRRHLVAWEQAIAQQLLTEAGRRTYFAEHSVEGLLRGDSKNRADFYKAGIEAGWLTINEARKLENLPTIRAERYQPNPPPKGEA